MLRVNYTLIFKIRYKRTKPRSCYRSAEQLCYLHQRLFLMLRGCERFFSSMEPVLMSLEWYLSLEKELMMIPEEEIRKAIIAWENLHR